MQAADARMQQLGCYATALHYSSCAEASAAGATPLHQGDPGYSSDLDRDGDGTACES